MEREIKELRRANEILKTTSALCCRLPRLLTVNMQHAVVSRNYAAAGCRGMSRKSQYLPDRGAEFPGLWRTRKIWRQMNR